MEYYGHEKNMDIKRQGHELICNKNKIKKIKKEVFHFYHVSWSSYMKTAIIIFRVKSPFIII